jgi:endonuclease/exonuclease/phosphatase family metal-dependent hydrolase
MVTLPSIRGGDPMPTTLCTFNANNLFVRYRFGQTFPGDMSGKSAVNEPTLGYLPMYDPDMFDLFNPLQRELTAKALSRDGVGLPDVLCLQEIESLIALRTFNERHLGSYYKRALLVDSRDFRQIDVGVLTNLEILSARTHVDDLDPKPDDPKRPFLFSRDCLEVELALPGARRLTVFINHLKSKFVDPKQANTMAKKKAARKKGDNYRGRQADRVIKLLKERFPGNAFSTELFAVVGDLNDEPRSKPLKKLFDNAGLEDALKRFPNEPDRWTHWFRGENSVSQIDALLLSPALSQATAGITPVIERRGISFARILQDGGIGPKVTHFQQVDDDPSPVDVPFRFPRFPAVDPELYASDHCPIFLQIPE